MVLPMNHVRPKGTVSWPAKAGDSSIFYQIRYFAPQSGEDRNFMPAALKFGGYFQGEQLRASTFLKLVVCDEYFHEPSLPRSKGKQCVLQSLPGNLKVRMHSRLEFPQWNCYAPAMSSSPSTSAFVVSSASLQRTGAAAWCRRLSVLAGHTFTQLVRMKVFYFLLVFSMIIFAVGFVFSSVSPDAELKLVKDTSFGVMQIFGVLFGVVGMALLLPKDIEDRTLYTILTKPVRRYEYLLGKYVGVILVLLLSLLMMDLMASAVLQIKFHWAYEDKLALIQSLADSGKIPASEIEQMKADELGQLSQQGLRMDLHLAVVAIFLKSAVITAVAMAISTFAGSTIFTMLATLCIFVIGHLQADARDALLRPEPSHAQRHAPQIPGMLPAPSDAAPPSVVARLFSGAVAVVFPDFQVYNVVDAVVAGKDLKGSDLVKMFSLSALYLAVYLGAAVFLFAEKEL
jgi:ABC-2 type transport system permease protein